MSWKVCPPEIEAAAAAAWVVCERLADERDALDPDSPLRPKKQKAVDEAFARYDEVRRNFFRLNIAGMSTVRQAMGDNGLIRWMERQVAWPDPADFGLTHFPRDDENPRSGEERAFIEAVSAVRDLDTGGVVPSYKLSWNEGYLVTPGEIEATLTIYDDRVRNGTLNLRRVIETIETGAGDADRAVEQAARVRFSWWMEWMREAAQHGGFRVW